MCVCECVQNPFRDPLEDSDEETVVEKKKEEVEGDLANSGFQNRTLLFVSFLSLSLSLEIRSFNSNL